MIALILGAFFVLFLPLALLQLVPNFVTWMPYAVLLEVVGLGTTHFFITLAVYLRAENLDYFRSSRRNALIYVGVPLLIFVFFAGAEAVQLWPRVPWFTPYFFAFVRFCDFFHVGRQSAGTLQIWKRSARLPASWRLGEQVLFVGLSCLQWETFLLGGHFRADLQYALLPAVGLGVLFLSLVAIHVSFWRRTEHGRARWVPLAYLVLQATCAASAVYDTRLYLTALAMHYVEYHAIMAPRLFGAALSSTRLPSRAFGVLQQRAWLFYAALASFVIAFELRSYAPATSAGARFFVHAFDGIFLVHYFLDAFLWKFRTPHYREALGPLYFDPAPPIAQVASPPRRSLPWGALTGAMLVGSTALVASPRGFATSLQQRAIDPMHAANHLRWGAELAEQGELTAARAHLAEALRRDPADARAERLLRRVNAAIATPPASTPRSL